MEKTWLVLDIGNTHTVGGLYTFSPDSARPELTQQIRFRTDAQATADEYRARLFELFQAQMQVAAWRGEKKIQWPPPLPERIIVSTVVPALESVLKESFAEIPCLTIHHEHHREFELNLPFPAQLGADRLANVAGALNLYRPPLLIVDAGTATTFCLVDGEARYIGGAITPGLEIGWKTLQSRAAKLFSVELRRPTTSVGVTTETQLQSGVLLGYEALIEGMVDRLLKDQPDLGETTLIATGGVINLLKLSERFRIEPDLTLTGLLRYGLLNPLGDSRA